MMFQPRLDPTIDMIARSNGCTYLEAARYASDCLGRPLSLKAAFSFVENFARHARSAVFTYEPVNDVMLFTVPSTDVTFVTDASMQDFYVQAVWQSPDGSDCWCTTKLPSDAVFVLLWLLEPDWIARRLSDAAAELRQLGLPDLAAKAERASATVGCRRR
jgi:hypothetical protein